MALALIAIPSTSFFNGMFNVRAAHIACTHARAGCTGERARLKFRLMSLHISIVCDEHASYANV